MWSDTAGCESFNNGHLASICDENRTFDLDGTNGATLDFISVTSGNARTSIASTLPPNKSYVQVALQDGQCTLSPVMRASDIESINNFITASNETGRNWQDCGLSPNVQYDTDVNHSIDHCGSCSTTCIRANMDSTCSAGTCSFGACDTGWVDLNENPDDGCECQNSGQDDPDLTTPFLDTNCDGVDGDVSKATFVATSGMDNAACGTMAAPCKTIQYGIDKTNAGNYVLVAGGTYPEAITLKNGVSVYGGYSAADWSRSTGNTVTVTGTLDSGHGWAVRGTNISSQTILNQITFVAPAATSAGASSVGIACTTCNGLYVAYAKVEAKAGKAGTNGANGGAKGADGNDDAQPGQGIGYASSDSNPMPGGNGGTSTCSANGGRGGDGAKTGNNAGSDGAAGKPAPRGGAGGGGWRKREYV